MKKAILGLIALTLAAASVPTVRAGGWNWSVSGGVVLGSAPAPPPVYYAAPAPVYYAAPGYGYCYTAPVRPAVVYTAPAPVVYAAPAPVVVYRAPVYVARPVVSVGFGYRGHHRRGCW